MHKTRTHLQNNEIQTSHISLNSTTANTYFEREMKKMRCLQTVDKLSRYCAKFLLKLRSDTLHLLNDRPIHTYSVIIVSLTNRIYCLCQ